MDSERYTVAELEAVGGSEWKPGRVHRVYFNRLRELMGLEIHFFGKASRGLNREIRMAYLNDEKISPHEAREHARRVEGGKLWWDMVLERWGAEGLDDEVRVDLVERLRAQLARRRAA